MVYFRSYIRHKMDGILIYLVSCGIFVVSFILYHLPMEAVLYPIILSGIIIVFYLTIDFVRCSIRHKKMIQLMKLPENLIDELESIQGCDCEDCKTIIYNLKEAMNRAETDFYVRYKDMIEYYTTWVHQIKTPIASMRLVLQNEDSSIARRLSDDLFRIEQYVEMVLAYLRMDSESSDYVFRQNDIDEMVRQVVRKLAGQFIGKGIKLEYEIKKRQDSIITDEKWYVFVVEQLLTNAIKYTNEGVIRIEYSPECGLLISDTGVGIAAEDLPRIFEKGYTGYNGRMDKKASGIGLYLCKRICDKLGLEIRVESVVGEGTKVNLKEKGT